MRFYPISLVGGKVKPNKCGIVCVWKEDRLNSSDSVDPFKVKKETLLQNLNEEKANHKIEKANILTLNIRGGI